MGLTEQQQQQSKSKEKDNRPRDWTYKVEFNEKDLPSLEQMVRHIRETHDTDMIEAFNKKCEQKLAGHPTILDNGVEIQEVTKTEDLVVNVGLQQCINIILGTSTDRWTFIKVAAGAGASPPAVSQTILDSTGGGPYSLSLATYGWSESKGMKLFFGALGPQARTSGGGILGASDIGDMGVFSTSGTIMLNRENFYNNRPTRTFSPDLVVYTSVFLFSSVIEFCPVA